MKQTQKISIRRKLVERLKELRLTPRESYSEIIDRMILSHDKMENM